MMRPGSVRTSSSRAPPPRSASRGKRGVGQGQELRAGRHQARSGRVGILHAHHLDLRGHDRLVGLGDEPAPFANHARGVRGRGDDGRFFDRHGHQHVLAVDPEVEAHAERQGVDADGVLHHAIRGLEVDTASLERAHVVERQIGAPLQLAAALVDGKSVEAGNP